MLAFLWRIALILTVFALGSVNYTQDTIPKLELERVISPGPSEVIRWSADRENVVTIRRGTIEKASVDALRNPTMTITGVSELVDTSPDNDRILYHTDAGELRLFDGVNDRRLLTEPEITAVALGPDNRIAAADPFSLILWGAGEGAAPVAYGRGGESFRPDTMRFSPGGSLIAFSGCILSEQGQCAESTLRLWETDTGREVMRVDQFNEINFIAFSDNGQQLYTQGTTEDFQPTIAVYDTASRRLLTEFLPDLDSWIAAGDFSGSRLAYATNNSPQIQILDVATSTISHTFSVSSATPREMRFSPDGVLLAIADAGGVYIVDVESGETVRDFSGHSDGIRSVAFSPDDDRIVTVARDNTLRIWDVNTGEQLNILTANGVTSIISGALFNQEGHVFTTGSDLTIRDGDEVIAFTNNGIELGVYDPAQNRYATGSAFGGIQIWDRNLEVIESYTEPEIFIRSLDFTADGNLLAFCQNNQVNIRDLTGETDDERFLVSASGGCQNLDISPNDRYVATGVQIYDRETEQSSFFGDQETDGTFDVAFNPDGTRLATTHFDGRVQLRDVATLEVVAELPFPADGARLAFSNDGTRLLTGHNGMILLWRLP